MITVYLATTVADPSVVAGLSRSLDSLPATWQAVDLYAVRLSDEALREAQDLLASHHTAHKVMPYLRRVAHSFTHIGNM